MITERWQQLMQRLGFEENTTTLAALIERYSEPHRHYHNMQHINDCLDNFRKVQKWENYPAVELALWFHDAIYEPYAKDNEKRSAQLAKNFLDANTPDHPLKPEVVTLIEATQFHAETTDEQQTQWMLDIDLSILGADDGVFDAYENNIRREYQQVPWLIYKMKRKSILKSFIDMPRIFRTAVFYSDMEERARRNIARSIKNL